MQPGTDIGALHRDYRPPVDHLDLPEIDERRLDRMLPEAQAAALMEMAEARQFLIRQICRENPGAFAAYCFADPVTGKPITPQWFHDDWQAAMLEHQRLLLLAPRDHGKSSQLIFRILWELGRNPNLRIKIFCATDGAAKDRLSELRKHIETNARLHEVFPDLVPDNKAEWSKHALFVQRDYISKEPSIEAVGIGSKFTGARVDILVADDVVDAKTAFSELEREKIKQIWYEDVTNLLEPDSRVWYLATLWHNADLSHELIANSEYHTLFYGVGSYLGQDHKVYADPENFGALWPAKWSEERLRERSRQQTAVAFNRAMRNVAVDYTVILVKPEWIEYVDLRGMTSEDLVIFTSYDTAKGLKEHNDYTACTVIAVDVENKVIYVVDAWHARLTLDQQAEAVFQDYRRWRPYRVLIEDVGLAALVQWVLNKYPELDGVVQGVNPRGKKFERLEAVTPLIENGHVKFSEKLDPGSERFDPQRGNLIGELLEFPMGAHDDLVDAFSQNLSHGARAYLLDIWAEGVDLDPEGYEVDPIMEIF